MKKLVRDWGAKKSPALIEEMITTALKIARDGMPSERRANEPIEGDPKLVTLNYFFTRKLSFVKEAHAFALLPGGFGTMDEAFEVLTLLQTGKARIVPVLLMDRPRGKYWEAWKRFLTKRLLKFGFISEEDFAFFKIKHNAQEAAAEVAQFYKVFHSARWAGDRFVIRVNRPLPNEALADLNNHFRDIVRTGEIVQHAAPGKQIDELETLRLPRLTFTPVRSRFGRFRQLIDSINSFGD